MNKSNKNKRLKFKSLKPKKKKIRIVLGENEKTVLLAVGVSALFLGSLALPGLPVALQPIIKMRGNKGFFKLLKKLRDKNMIYLGGDKVRLTSRGIRLYKIASIDQIKIAKPDKWDGLWRLISYDVPNKYNKSRDHFRLVLENLGFIRIQDSLWVYPYECKQELAVIANTLGLGPYVIMMITDKLPKESEWLREFDLEDYK